MKKAAVAIALIGLTIGLLLLLVALIIPKWIDIERYRPSIEKRIAEATGRMFSIGGPIQLDLIPHTRLTVSDMALGSPAGIDGPPLLTVQRLEVRLRPLPLVSGEFAIELLRIDGLQIVLFRDVAGRGNWEGLIGADQIAAAAHELMRSDDVPFEGIRLASGHLRPVIDETIVRDASVRWMETDGKPSWQLSGIGVRTAGLSYDRPFTANLAVRIRNQPLTVAARIGPLRGIEQPDRSPVPVEADFNLADIARVMVRGSLGAAGALSIHASAETFSLRQLATAFGHRLPTADPMALERFGFGFSLTGDPREAARIDGHIELDDSRVTISGNARRVGPTQIRAAIKVGGIDIDRYLPPVPDSGSDGQHRNSRGVELSGGQGPPALSSRQLPAADITATFLADALTVLGLQTQESTLTAPDMIFNVAGQADLAAGTIDVSITPQAARNLMVAKERQQSVRQTALRVFGPIKEPMIFLYSGEPSREQGRPKALEGADMRD